ncbi:MAG: SDR family oxidoreductase [Actinomycetota bacterium]|nr:SDR family oxidoreductase [Actinomycetota bacterium]
MRALVTGGGGFIGSHIAERLVKDSRDVRVLDNFSTGRRDNLLHLQNDLEIVEGDIQSYERVHNAVRGCDVVFHQAALPSVPRSIQDPLTSNGCNVIGTLNVLLAARDEGVSRVVFASSSSVYGSNPTLPKHEELPTAPFSPYAVAKLAGEGYCRSFYEVYGLPTVALRYFNVFGPRQDPLSQYSAVIPKFIAALLSDESPYVHGDGEQSRDFTYVENVVRANLLAAAADDVAGKQFNIACGDRLSLNTMIAELRSIIGSERGAEYGPTRPGDVRHSQADISRARAELSFEPQTSFREGLEYTVEHYRELAARAAA